MEEILAESVSLSVFVDNGMGVLFVSTKPA